MTQLVPHSQQPAEPSDQTSAKGLDSIPTAKPIASRKNSATQQSSNVKVTTEVFLSKVKMLSPVEKNSRSTPKITAFPSNEVRKSRQDLSNKMKKRESKNNSADSSNKQVAKTNLAGGAVPADHLNLGTGQ